MYYKLLMVKTLTANTIALKSDKDGKITFLPESAKFEMLFLPESAKFKMLFLPESAKFTTILKSDFPGF